MAQVDGAGAGAGQPASEDVGAGAGGEPQATLELAVTQQPAVGATRPATSPTGPVSGVNLQLNQKGGGDGDANAMESTAALATASPSKYTPSGAIAPLKRPKSAYFLFMESVRSDVAKSLPAGSGVAEVAKGIGERWRALDEVAKKEYNERAAADKERYNREKAERERLGIAVSAAPKAAKRKSDSSFEFPLQRIKRLVKMDPDVKNIGGQPAVMIAKAAELFVEELAELASRRMGNRKTIKPVDVGAVIHSTERFSFLADDFADLKPAASKIRLGGQPQKRRLQSASEAAAQTKSITTFFGGSSAMGISSARGDEANIGDSESESVDAGVGGRGDDDMSDLLEEDETERDADEIEEAAGSAGQKGLYSNKAGADGEDTVGASVGSEADSVEVSGDAEAQGAATSKSGDEQADAAVQESAD